MKAADQFEESKATYDQKEAIYHIMNLSSKLVEAIPQNNDDFLWELLRLSLRGIGEADYGSISIIDHDVWRYAAAIGHDWNKLSSLTLKSEYLLSLEKPENSISSNVYVIDDILNQDIDIFPEIKQRIREASMPIKQSLVAQICFNGKCIGHLCLDITADSLKTFGADAKRIIKPIADLASAYLTMKKAYSMVDDLEQIVTNRTQAVRNLLDNVGQGLLTFGNDLIVHLDYSYECLRIFGAGIEAKSFPRLIYSDQKEEAAFVEQILHEVFDCKDLHKTKVYLSLLPKEIEYNNRDISLEYKLVNDIYKPEEKAVMVIMTEITETRRLENLLKEDAQIIRMVANVAGNFSGFLECVKEFQYFYGSKLHEIIERNQSVCAIYADIFREIHTFKGSFSQFDMKSSVENFNSMESALAYIGNMLDHFSRKDICAFIYSFDMIHFLNKDMEILQEKLGSQFLSMGEMITVDKQKLAEIENEILRTCAPLECKTLLPMIKSLRYKSLKEMLSTYPDYAVKLGERLEKPITAFSILGDDLLLDSEQYGPFIKALVHIFRNCVDHGLEAADKRQGCGKPEYGTISCSIHVMKDELEISIEDDGAGIDYEKVRNKAISCGLCHKEQADRLGEKDLLELIFRDSFTTMDKITDVSGRGMGLSAVKSELEKLGGRIEIYTTPGKGTKFRLLMPVLKHEQAKTLYAKDFLQPIMTTAVDFLKEHIGERLNINSINAFHSDHFEMKHYTAFISIKGIFEGMFAISMDNQAAKVLLQSMVYEEIEEQLLRKYIKDVMAESANMILGNSIHGHLNMEDLIMIGTPNVIYSASEASYDGNEIYGFKIHTDCGAIVLSIIQ